MTIYHAQDNKEFMHQLLKGGVFDLFEAREVYINTFTSFEIHCNYHKDFFPPDSAQDRKYCLWKEIKPYAFDIIKGSRLPKLIKIILAADKEKTNEISSNASALFLNITYENGNITCITGSSTKNFTLDKTVEYQWDAFVSEFLKQNQVVVSTQSY